MARPSNPRLVRWPAGLVVGSAAKFGTPVTLSLGIRLSGVVKARTEVPSRLNSYTDGPYSSDTRKLPVLGMTTKPSGSRDRPSTLEGDGAMPLKGTAPVASVNLIVCATWKSDIAAVAGLTPMGKVRLRAT